MSLVVRFPDSLRPERTYAASVVFDAHLGLPHEVVFENRRDILMHAAGDLKRTVQLPDLVFAAGDQDWPARAVRPATILMDAIAELGDRKANDATFGEATQTALFDADVFGTVFWYLTRLEEVQSPDRDQHGRFPASDSRDENQRPYVDELVDALGRVLVSVWPTLQLRRHKFEFVATHDVDRPYKHLFQSPIRLLRSMARDVLREGHIARALRSPLVRSRVRRGHLHLDPFDTFDWLMNQSERQGIQSVFYFICANATGGIDGDYRIDDPRMRALLRRVHVRGHGIGLHGSYRSALDSAVLAGEVRTLRRVCESERIPLDRVRGRQHVLRFEPSRTVSVWAEAQIDEDSTLGHAGRAGFRCGTCRPFSLFDVPNRKVTGVMERPLIAMEGTLLEPRYEGLSLAGASLRINELMRRCQMVGGSFVLLWHNCRLEDDAAKTTYMRALMAAATASNPAIDLSVGTT